jgi:exonuclease SbcC
MEPTQISLTNFLSYREETVDLATVSCAALVGENGSGKSSIVEALTWSLYGQGTKGGVRELDNYITRGENEGRVDLQFRLHGATYRVVRGRSIARNKTTLELSIMDGDDWRVLSGKTIAETQAIIEQTLRMNYQTFISSAIVLQGQSDAFTANMTDQERKEALAQILDLNLWDQMQERVREKGRATKAELNAVEQSRQRLLECSSGKPTLEARRREVVEQVGTSAVEIDQVTSEVADLEAQVRQKPALEQTVADVTREISRKSSEMEFADNEARRARGAIANAEAEIQSKQTILAMREQIEAAADMEAEIATDVAAFDQKAQEYMRLTNTVATLENRVTSWDACRRETIGKLEAGIGAASRQAATMDKVPCAGDVKATCPLLAGAKAAVTEMADLQTKLNTIKTDANPHSAEWYDAVKARDAVGYDANAHQAARAALQDIKRTSILKTDLDTSTARVTELEQRVVELRGNLTAFEQKRAGIFAEIQTLDVRRQSIQQELASITPAAMALTSRQATLTTLRQQEASLRTELGRLEAALEQVAKAETELATIEEGAKVKRDQLTVYDLLDQACGKKAGVPALIVENAVPEIERLANDMLTKMAGGRLTVRLDTQAEGKTTGTMQEVLRITVLDGGAERPYQTYSGAERFMVDLALRVALSKFLAHRAGAEIRLFVLDEGLGACDQSNRQAVMAAIQTVAQEFGKTIVVTHIAELQDALPQRIEVTKGPDGSKVRVA